jgi:ATP-dependent protease ClpP protease subunit
VSALVCAQLLFLEAENPEKDIAVYINSPGGVSSYEEVEQSLDCDHVMSAEEARDWGLVDHVYKSRDSLQVA